MSNFPGYKLNVQTSSVALELVTIFQIEAPPHSNFGSYKTKLSAEEMLETMDVMKAQVIIIHSNLLYNVFVDEIPHWWLRAKLGIDVHYDHHSVIGIKELELDFHYHHEDLIIMNPRVLSEIWVFDG